MQEPSEVIVLVGVYYTVLIALGNAFTDPIVAEEFDSVNNPAGAVLQNSNGRVRQRYPMNLQEHK
jgi:hypothetical protein